MRTLKFICCAIFLIIINSTMNAQSKGPIATKKIIDKGTKGDVVLGEKNKQAQLKNAPALLRPTESFGRKDIIRSSKKSSKTQKKKGS